MKYLKMSIQDEPDDNGNVRQLDHIISDMEIQDNAIPPGEMLYTVYQMLCRKFDELSEWGQVGGTEGEMSKRKPLKGKP